MPNPSSTNKFCSSVALCTSTITGSPSDKTSPFALDVTVFALLYDFAVSISESESEYAIFPSSLEFEISSPISDWEMLFPSSSSMELSLSSLISPILSDLICEEYTCDSCTAESLKVSSTTLSAALTAQVVNKAISNKVSITILLRIVFHLPIFSDIYFYITLYITIS